MWRIVSIVRSISIPMVIVLGGKPLPPSLDASVFFHQTCILLDDFQRDIAAVVVLKRSPPAAKIAPPPIDLNLAPQGIVSPCRRTERST